MGKTQQAERDYPEEEYPLKSLTEAIISAAIAVHKELGPGFLEGIYENPLAIELQSRGHSVGRQLSLPVRYQGQEVGEHRLDMLVDDEIVVELKSVDALAAVHKAQLRGTLRAAGRQIGLLINFNQPTLVEGVRRVIC